MKRAIHFLFCSIFLLPFQAKSQNDVGFLRTANTFSHASDIESDPAINNNTDTSELIKKEKSSFTFFIPNAFSPDDNGINDIFKPVMIDVDENDYQLCIFDRQGNLILNSFNNPSLGWNGKINNSADMMQNDVYVWKVVLKDKDGVRHSFIGTVNLIRL